MSKRMSLFLSLLLCVIGVGWCSKPTPTSSLPGHMQPLGSHREPKQIARINYMPTPREFQKKYVRPKKPVIFEGLMSDLDVIKNWQSDKYLRTHFGDNTISIEMKKKEIKSLYRMKITMEEFLDKYNESDIYMESDPPHNMYNEWQVPQFMLCGGFLDHINMVSVWFSSGDTKSVLQTASFENLHCLISGTKKFVMMEPHFSGYFGPEHYKKGFYDIDIDQVNMTAYPRLAKIPWHQATLNSGDCFYLPYEWINQVTSEGRNMGISISSEVFTFNYKSCPSDESELPNFASLEKYELAMETMLKELLNGVKNDDGKVYSMDLLSPEFEEMGVRPVHLDELLEELQPGCKGVLHVDEIQRENLRNGAVYVLHVFSGLYVLHSSGGDPPSPGNDQQRDEL